MRRSAVLGIVLLVVFSGAFAQGKQPIRLVPIVTGLHDARSLYVTGIPNLYIAETGRHRILKLALTGERLDSLGNQGMGTYQFDHPVDIDATNGLKIYVSDYNNGRIQVFDRRLQLLSSITPPAGNNDFYTYRPTSLVVNNMRELFFYDDGSERIVKYNSNGAFDSSFPLQPNHISTAIVDLGSFNDQLLVLDARKGVVHFLSDNGQYIKFIGGFKDVKGITTDPSSIWIITSSQIDQLNGQGTRLQSYQLPENIEPADIAVYQNQVFVLTGKNLYKGTIKKKD